MKASFQSKDQNWQNEQTVYWFEVNGERYGVSDINGDRSIVDCDGSPVNLGDAKNAHLADLPACITAEIEQA